MVGQKHSKKRDAILACLRSTKSHPSAEWIYGQLKPTIPNLSLGTVYRNLAAFKQEGVIVSLGVVEGNERFDANTAPHVHFVCTHCSAVIDVDNVDVPDSLSRQVSCGSVRNCTLTFTGICNHCVPVDAQS